MSGARTRARYNGATAAAGRRPDEPPGRGSPESAIPMRKQKSPVKDLLLSRYAPLADGIATLFFPYAEVVIHDLHDQTVLYLANNLSKREVGDDSALEEIDHSARERVIGPYEKLNWDGRRMRCVSNILFDDEGHPAGMMCINFNIAVFDDVRATLDLFIKGAGVVAQPDELFRDDWQERINTFLHGWLRERQIGLNGLTRAHRRELVEALYAEGAFRGKSAANYVANVLGMGRATVYKHLKHLKDTQGDA
ncbi:helix-turn-helix transcriptional regulator [Burkholderia ubonensis]|uniref:helix-turn-helix transcriptional regulator n=2 Tax=Burkholderia ubonensis TaxID=101571 RepID=UPI0008FE7EE2|nr:PAS domain-containing protein [Burkholderia ubonensis]